MEGFRPVLESAFFRICYYIIALCFVNTLIFYPGQCYCFPRVPKLETPKLGVSAPLSTAVNHNY